MCCVQFPTHRGFSGEEEDGEGWREIVIVFQCNQHTPSCAPHLLLNWIHDKVVALYILQKIADTFQMVRWTCFQMDIFRPIRFTHHSNHSDGYIQWTPDIHFYHLDRKTEVIICNTACKFRRIPKYAPTFLHTTLRQNWGRCVCSNIQLVSSISSP